MLLIELIDLIIVTGDNRLMVRTLRVEGINLRHVRGAFRFAFVELSMEVGDLNVQRRNSSIVLLIELGDRITVSHNNRITVANFNVECINLGVMLHMRRLHFMEFSSVTVKFNS